VHEVLEPLYLSHSKRPHSDYEANNPLTGKK